MGLPADPQQSSCHMRFTAKIFLITLLMAMQISGFAVAEEVFVIKTSDIIPYDTCVAGLREALSAYSFQVFNMEGDLEKGREQLNTFKDNKQSQIIIAVGPQAAFVLSEINYKAAKLFCMVLNPQKVIPREKRYSGVSLNIPVSYQLKQIKSAFPERKRIGVFFSLPENKQVMESLQQEAVALGVGIVGFPIATASDILPAIASKNFTIDVLLMVPDEKINSQKIVEYIIKESLRRKIPVVGYNSWFAKNGAILSFLIDYRDVGVQAGAMVAQMIKAGSNTAPERIESPAKIQISIDLKTAEKLGIQISATSIQQANEVIR